MTITTNLQVVRSPTAHSLKIKFELPEASYVCMHVYMYVCMYVYMYACMYVCRCVCACVRMYVCMYVCMHAGLAKSDVGVPCLAAAAAP